LSSCALVALSLACGSGGSAPPPAAAVPEIAPDAVLALAGTEGAPLLLDVRTPEEFASGHVPGARNVSHEQLAARLGELGPPGEVVVYCESGRRAAMAAEVLAGAGFSVQHLTGDMRAWREAGRPLER
jgi:rhodanese-related sulfurtransferase